MDAEVLQFGKDLLDTEDLDPVYCYLYNAHPDYNDRWLERWLLTYSMFYHAGVAEASINHIGRVDYWNFIRSGIPSEPNGGFPRSEERRHFRGHAAEEAIELMAPYEPEEIVDSWYLDLTFQGVIKNVQKYKLYGPWIAFKLADMGERVLGLPIDFSDCELGIYREPRAGAALVKYGDSDHPIETAELKEVINYIIEGAGVDRLAPPRYDRPINVQEAETILCKFKSYKHGHYYVEKDLVAVEKALKWRRDDNSQVPDLHNQLGEIRL